MWMAVQIALSVFYAWAFLEIVDPRGEARSGSTFVAIPLAIFTTWWTMKLYVLLRWGLDAMRSVTWSNDGKPRRWENYDRLKKHGLID
jgi:hypothetical protein